MTSDQVTKAIGKPDRMTSSTDASGTSETWFYPANITVTLLNGVVRSVHRG